MNYQTLASRFLAPDNSCRPMLFWLWNGVLTREGIAAQIADFAAKGAGGFFFHPMGENFRLGDFLEGLTPPYLSDEYFALVRHAVECARAHGLYAWLYDEGGWPSGTAQGQVIAGHPEYTGKRLHVQRLGVEYAEQIPTEVVAALAIPDMGIPEPVDPRQLAQGLWPHPELLIFTLQSDGYPVDVLNPTAIRRFIEVTHERYAATVGEFFGNTIPGMFTDETSLGGALGRDAIPWTRGFLEDLAVVMGTEASLYLPLLFAPEVVGADLQHRYSEHEFGAARCHYYDLLTRRFGAAYWQQLTDWCGEHGLIHTGHVGGEDNLPDHLSFGHFFRTAGALHAPGIDVIWRQLFPGQDNFPFPRLAASAVKAHPREAADEWGKLCPSETNAVYGFGFHYGQARWLADYQFQGGINLYAPMATHYTCEGGRLYCTMSHFGPGNPLWPSYKAFADYLGRLCTLTRHTVESAPVAVYYPVEALWTIEGIDEAWASLREACLTLTNLQIAFDFLDPDLLPQLQPDDLRACHGDLAYREIIVPAVVTLSNAALSKLADLALSGVKVHFLEHWPLQSAEIDGAEEFQRCLQALEGAGHTPLPAALLEATLEAAPLGDPWLRLADPAPTLLLSARNLTDGRVYLLTNDSAQVLEPYLLLHTPGAMAVEAWDARDGEVIPLLQTDAQGHAELRPILSPWSSMILGLRPLQSGENLGSWGETAPEREFARWLADPTQRPQRPPHVDVLAEFSTAAAVRVVDEYVIAEGNVELVENAEPRHPFVDGPAELQFWQDWGMPEFSGHVEYRFELVVSPHFVDRPLLLDLGELFWTAAVYLNGEHLGDSLWSPHAFELTGRVQAGGNDLRVIVGNSLANQACEESVIQQARERGWCNPYLQRTLPMMREDLRGGLIGPVRVLVMTLQPQ